MMEAEKAKASLTSYKGHFTRQKRAFDRRLDELHPEVAENWGMLDSAFKKYQKGVSTDRVKMVISWWAGEGAYFCLSVCVFVFVFVFFSQG